MHATLMDCERFKGARVGETHKAGVDGVDAHAQPGVLARECLGQVVLHRPHKPFLNNP